MLRWHTTQLPQLHLSLLLTAKRHHHPLMPTTELVLQVLLCMISMLHSTATRCRPLSRPNQHQAHTFPAHLHRDRALPGHQARTVQTQRDQCRAQPRPRLRLHRHRLLLLQVNTMATPRHLQAYSDPRQCLPNSMLTIQTLLAFPRPLNHLQLILPYLLLAFLHSSTSQCLLLVSRNSHMAVQQSKDRHQTYTSSYTGQPRVRLLYITTRTLTRNPATPTSENG